MLNSKVPPLTAITEPMEMLPDTTEQFTQLLLFIAKVPTGGDGVVHVEGMVNPTETVLLLHPLAAKTLAPITRGVL